jgi:hypothetical protein
LKRINNYAERRILNESENVISEVDINIAVRGSATTHINPVRTVKAVRG